MKSSMVMKVVAEVALDSDTFCLGVDYFFLLSMTGQKLSFSMS